MLVPDPVDGELTDQEVAELEKCLQPAGYLLTDNGHVTRLSLRRSLLSVCSDLAGSESSQSGRLKETIQRLSSLYGFSELIGLDPFSGSGAIPVEMCRLGISTIAGEYNPVAAFNLRLLLEHCNHLTPEMFSEVETLHSELLSEWQKDLKPLYPSDSRFGQPLGYIHFRSVYCEGPKCGSLVPATSKFLLDVRRKIGVTYVGDLKPGGLIKTTVVTDPEGGFPKPTMLQGSLTCPACGFTTRRSDVMRQLAIKRPDTVIVAVVYRDSATNEIRLAPPSDLQKDALLNATAFVKESVLQGKVPDEMWPLTELRRFSPPLYGYSTFSACHTTRQLAALGHLASFGRRVAKYPFSGPLLMGLAVERNTSFCRWRNDRGGAVEGTFSGKSIGMIWDFFEADPLHAANDLLPELRNSLSNLLLAKKLLPGDGTVIEGPAQELPLPDDSVDILYTDPPYYDSVPYSHLSDWSFVWMKRSGLAAAAGGDGLTRKTSEIVVDRPHSRSPSLHDQVYFADEISKAFNRLRTILKPDAVGVVVFAHLNTSAWESLLEAVIVAGFRVTAAWPIETERGGRLQAQGTASLQSSIHLVVRPRECVNSADGHSEGEWRDVIGELPGRIHEWMPRLAAEGIVGADAIFACLGPALEVFSRYSRVEKANGDTATLREYLEFVWAAVSTEALSLIFKDADAAGLEPDARLTAMWLWTLGGGKDAGGTAKDGDADEESTSDDEDAPVKSGKLSGFTLEYDAARKIAQGLGVHLEQCQTLVEVKGDKARMLPVKERAEFLFGKSGSATATQSGGKATKKKAKQKSLFEEMVAEEPASNSATWGDLQGPTAGSTVLDRVHQSMILFAAGRGELLKRFLVEDGIGKDARFWKLAQSLSALYPKECEEKRWVDGVLARKKGLGL